MNSEIESDSQSETTDLLGAIDSLPADQQHKLFALMDEAGDPDKFLAELDKHPDLLSALMNALGLESGSSLPQADLDIAVAGERQYRQTGSLDALDRSIAAWQRILHHSTFANAAPADRVRSGVDAGCIFQRRYWAVGDPGDLERALDLWGTALDDTAPRSADRAACLNNLANGLLDRFHCTGNAADLEDAVSRLRAAISITPADSGDLASRLNNLSNVLSERHMMTGAIGDLDEAIAGLRQVTGPASGDAARVPEYLNNLGSNLRRRFQYARNPADLDEAITCHRHAIDAAPIGSPARPVRLNNLGAALANRYTDAGDPADLQDALVNYRQAIATTQPGATIPPSWFNNLSLGLRDMYRITGNDNDLEEAHASARRAVDMALPGSPELPIYCNSLGLVENEKYHRSGALTDLNAAIANFRRAIDATAEGSAYLALYLSMLGQALQDRFRHSGSLDDLNDAIDSYLQGVRKAPADSPSFPLYLNNLSIGLLARYDRTTDIEDLNNAITYLNRAIDATQAGSSFLASRLGNLGSGLSRRYDRLGDYTDLEQSIDSFRKAIDTGPQDAAEMPTRYDNLGTALMKRHRHSRDLDDLNNAVASIGRSVEMLAEGSPNLPRSLNHYANALTDRYMHTENSGDLRAAIGAFRRSCQLGSQVRQEIALYSAHNWSRWALERRSWSEIIEAYEYGIVALDRLVRVQWRRSDKESWLRNGQELAAIAAYAWAELEDNEQAVVALERGRARLMSEVLERTRTDLEQLPELGSRALYDRFRNNADEIASLQRQLEEPGKARKSREMVLRELRSVHQRQEQATAEIRKVGGYEDFLAVWTAEQIKAVLAPHPKDRRNPKTSGDTADAATSVGVYLCTTPLGGMGLLLHPAGIEVVRFDLDEEALVGMLHEWLASYQAFLQLPDASTSQSWFHRLDSETRRLWELVIDPLAKRLQSFQQDSADSLKPPIVTLIPTGLLSLLPLHAAWIEDFETPTGRRYFQDDFAIRYAPSALALHHCNMRATIADSPQLLAINEPRPVTLGGPLINAAREVNAIASLFKNSTVLTEQAAQRNKVLAELARAQVAHFSCHGSNSWQNPLDSGLLLANDEFLTVRDFLELHLPGARLATLSACETGMVGTDLPDEVVMLPGALVQAGYAGVVASLWSVADVSTAMLMVRFYQYWRDDKLEPAYALRAAQRWVRDTTNQDKADYFGQLVPGLSTHMADTVAAEFFSTAKLSSEGLEERTFEHPFWWAAFYLTGV